MQGYASYSKTRYGGSISKYSIKSLSSLVLRTEGMKCTEEAYLAFCGNFVKAM